MENRLIFRAGIKKHKGSLIGIALLVFLTTVSFCTVLTVYLQGNRYIQTELERTEFGTLTAWVSDVPDLNTLVTSLKNQEGVENVEIQNLIYADYEGNGIESDSEGQLIPWQNSEPAYRFLKNDLSGYEKAPQEIKTDEIYLSPSMQSILHASIGDTIIFSIARNGMNRTFTVAGFFEDPVRGSSMIGMKGFLIAPSVYKEILINIEEEGADALARSGAMLHITADRDSHLTVSELSRRLNENTSLTQYTVFIHSKDTIHSFMSILQNAFCGLLAVFAAVLLGVVFIVLGHSISGIVEQEWKNLGILKTMGMTGKQLVQLQKKQYIISFFTGVFAGVILAVPVIKIVSRMMITTSGIRIPSEIPVVPVLLFVVILLCMNLIFINVRLKNIHKIAPLEAIRGEQTQKDGKKSVARNIESFPVRAKGLFLFLAIRQVAAEKKRYAGACIVAVLLVFFASLTGRMNDWLQPDGQGMMDAFNPADLDLGIQVSGDLTQEEMEQVVLNYSKITDSYALAMPSVSVNGTSYTANVITDPGRFHISRGETCSKENEVVLTETLADDLGVTIGDIVSIRGDTGTGEFTVSGIYHCANDMGANLGMSREGYLSIGSDDPRLWCHHYFLEDSSQKQVITEILENTCGGDVHVHENSWPGLFGIIRAMHLLIVFMYAMSAIFIGIVTVMTGNKILAMEQKDMGIYKALGCPVEKLRTMFALRFGIVAVLGAVLGTILAGFLTDPLVAAVMRLAGISNFSSSPSLITILVPGCVVAVMFFVFAYLASRRLKKEDMSALTAE